ncbi:DUF6164 family protein [Marinomonas mediterranea]|uniref:DUF6164 family protein n=1 Tax=Marinomonas mediterranea TaxID=119864 RepID=UPI0023490658|nr:DUF6164 family protein [Marinomonas mediterranea]WCN07869.1 hypothetical protein GV055_02465 [Marinomonas mediterranea]
MAKLVFRLKNVPDDEVNEIRQLLDEHDIPFYETSAGRWQISLAGIWVKDNQLAIKARQLIVEDQNIRALAAVPISKKDWIVGVLQHARHNPVEMIFTIAAIAMVLGLSLFPFFLAT